VANGHVIPRQEQHQHEQAHGGSAHTSLHRASTPQVEGQQAVPQLLARLVVHAATSSSVVIVAAVGTTTAGALHQSAWASNLERLT